MYCADCMKQICVYNSREGCGNRESDKLENKIKIVYTANPNDTHRPHESALIKIIKIWYYKSRFKWFHLPNIMFYKSSMTVKIL